MTNDNKLAVHIDELLKALKERLPNDALLKERTAAIERNQPNDIGDLRRVANELRSATEETLANMYYRIDLHSSAILKLTNDPEILGPVQTVARLLQTEISDARDLISELEGLTSAGDLVMLIMKMIGAGTRALPRQGELDAAMAKLERYSSAA